MWLRFSNFIVIVMIYVSSCWRVALFLIVINYFLGYCWSFFIFWVLNCHVAFVWCVVSKPVSVCWHLLELSIVIWVSCPFDMFLGLGLHYFEHLLKAILFTLLHHHMICQSLNDSIALCFLYYLSSDGLQVIKQ